MTTETINVCLELLAGVSVPVTLPDALEKMGRANGGVGYVAIRWVYN